MKTGLASSVLLHLGVLGFAVISLSAPKPFEIDEAIAVTAISETELNQLVKGEKRADTEQPPAPEKTETEELRTDAVNVGSNVADLDNAPTPLPSERKVESSAPAAPPLPMKRPEHKPVEKPVEVAKAEPEPEPEKEQKAEQKPEAEVDPVAELLKKSEEDRQQQEKQRQAEEAEKKAEEEKRKAAEEEERKKRELAEAEAKRKAEAEAKKLAEAKALDDQIKALINKQEEKGGGARSSTQTAGAGASRTNAPKLSASEMAALRDQLGGCWSIDAGIVDADSLLVSVTFSLNQNGKLEGQPRVTKSSGNPQFDRSAVRAIQKCDVQGLRVPEGKYETWREVIVNFDPRDMFF
ncbi:cell envelope integrity protein TolA [Notoacmeibacter sp. MSK16QG-6]|uniref:cell envelope integrity protein TolA n=1 Tax=Notoacmeibacter sp. MSK16QG-6 TaxID=2957982 RepID=UPI0020A07905|nr:cell envelope integrity protein TolA [Notoacmeibacter sp. MSK16QG-6]MCP1200116.1 cell envelope integrity protein TolA [Notoacmeibacter sp. MSK16QG-6]